MVGKKIINLEMQLGKGGETVSENAGAAKSITLTAR